MQQNNEAPAEPRRLNSRVLGLDVGERRIGVAISDPDRHFALPLNSVDVRNGDPIEQIGVLVRADEVTEVVVGLPLTLSGETGSQAISVTAFAEQLETRLGLLVHLWDERLSTQEAMRRVADEPRNNRRDRGRRPAADTDAIAASIILQAYLDRERLQGPAL